MWALMCKHTKASCLTALAFLSRAHTSDGVYRFPKLVPGHNSRWTLNVDACLTFPIDYPQRKGIEY